MDLPVKYYPEKLRELIKKRVYCEYGKWNYIKDSLLNGAFVWYRTPEGRKFWERTFNTKTIEELEYISENLK